MTLLRVNDPGDIDLSKHGVIEASAGTGKTYTIENLVVRLILEKNLTIDQILLVTFTEKAAGEMGVRIRGNILKALNERKDDPDASLPLQSALDRFDEASIQTIHGFCQRMLNLYALENGLPFSTEVVDDNDFYEEQFRTLLRKTWPARFGGLFESLLRRSGFVGSKTDRENWEKVIRTIANRWNASLGDRLEPEPPENLDAFLNDYENRWAKALNAIGEVIGEVDPERPEQNEFYQGYAALNINAQTKKAMLEKVVLPVAQLVGKHRTNGSDWPDFGLILQKVSNYEKFKKVGGSFTALVPDAWNKGVDNMAQVCPRLPELVEALESLRQLDPEKKILAALVRELRSEVDRAKMDRGAIAYSDMILRLHAALHRGDEVSQRFLGELRQRYAYALVDEFQDTDSAQWGIFRKIFLESDSGNRLYVIGDPKQSIYRFRGADVEAYLGAKEEILAHPEGAGYSLAVNWRSTADLIETFNQAFSSEGGWFRAGSGISHDGVQPPPKEKRPSNLLSDPTGTSALTLVKFDVGMGLRRIRFAFYRWIAAEIQRIVENREAFRIQAKGAERILELNDICVLVRTRNEATAFQEVLGDRIPNTFYKKDGLYQSREALHLSFLLRALADPGDSRIRAALLTDFFRIPPERLSAADGVEPDSPARRLFERWLDLADRREWSALFHSILSDGAAAVVRDDSGAVHPTSERSWTNYLHLIENLQSEPDLHQWDAVDLSERLDRCRKGTADLPGEVGLHRLESETPKVQIMTLHMSKGLEFPVVFVAGGLTETSSSDPYLCIHDKNSGRLVYDLEKKPENKDIAKLEAEDESGRLFYVGLTRAQHKLYLPFLSANGARSSGPLAAGLRESIEKVFGSGQSPHVSMVEFQEPGEMQAPHLPPTPEERAALSLPQPLLPEERLDFWDRRTRSHSFTSLAHHSKQSRPRFEPGEEAVRDADELEPASDLSFLASRAEALPKGERTGTMMHALFETIDWRSVVSAPDLESIQASGSAVLQAAIEAVDQHRVASLTRGASREDLAKEAVRWIWNALRTPLPIGEGFRLGDLTTRDRLHEMEFHLPLRDERSGDAHSEGGEGLLTGFIDLAFRAGGRYYLLDWKTNWLPEYSAGAIEESMKDNDYLLQYRIYRVALERLLGLSLTDSDSWFGGVIYLYLRGLDPSRPEMGVYWKPAHEIEAIGEIERDLSGRIFGADRARGGDE